MAYVLAHPCEVLAYAAGAWIVIRFTYAMCAFWDNIPGGAP